MFLLNRIKFRPFAKRQNSSPPPPKKKNSAHLFVSHQSLLPVVYPKTTKRHEVMTEQII